MMLEKLNGFAEGKYDVTLSGNDVATDYESKRTDAWSTIEGLNITQRFLSTSKFVSQYGHPGLILSSQQSWSTHIEPHRDQEPHLRLAARSLLRPPLPRLSLRKLPRLHQAPTTTLHRPHRTLRILRQQPLRSRKLPHHHRPSSPSPSRRRSMSLRCTTSHRRRTVTWSSGRGIG